VNEQFSLHLDVLYQGEPFTGVIVLFKTRKGFSDNTRFDRGVLVKAYLELISREGISHEPFHAGYPAAYYPAEEMGSIAVVGDPGRDRPDVGDDGQFNDLAGNLFGFLGDGNPLSGMDRRFVV